MRSPSAIGSPVIWKTIGIFRFLPGRGRGRLGQEGEDQVGAVADGRIDEAGDGREVALGVAVVRVYDDSSSPAYLRPALMSSSEGSWAIVGSLSRITASFLHPRELDRFSAPGTASVGRSTRAARATPRSRPTPSGPDHARRLHTSLGLTIASYLSS